VDFEKQKGRDTKTDRSYVDWHLKKKHGIPAQQRAIENSQLILTTSMLWGTRH